MTYLYRGDHADTLASGRPVEPGEEIAKEFVDVDDPHDARLIRDGLLHELPKPKPKAEREAAEKKDRDAFEAEQNATSEETTS